MFMFLGKTVLFLNVSCNVFAMNFHDAQIIMARLLKANGIQNGPKLYLEKNKDNNAYSEGDKIVVYTGMLRYCRNADELALILGHELGHYTQSPYMSSWAAELDADQLGSKYERIAGYNQCKGALAVNRFHEPASDTHPPSDMRYNRIKC